ncbi:MAG: hypothetical protein A4E35_00447 [Methanoregula sp. PtaU1.Bin051]|nr:MAG: hypothetical protein A4E35_00447 [Methanoregula sp. PtaU1.Bin051]
MNKVCTMSIIRNSEPDARVFIIIHHPTPYISLMRIIPSVANELHSWKYVLFHERFGRKSKIDAGGRTTFFRARTTIPMFRNSPE